MQYPAGVWLTLGISITLLLLGLYTRGHTRRWGSGSKAHTIPDLTREGGGTKMVRAPASAAEGKLLLPIIILTFERLDVLSVSVASYRRCINASLTPFEIVFSDNNSSHPPLLRYLSHEVHQQPKHHSAYLYRNRINNPFYNMVTNTRDWFSRHPTDAAPYYVVTDPDVALDDTPGDILRFYQYLLETHRAANVVGPMLRIDDIPESYPLRAKVIKGHTAQFWKWKPTASVLWGGRECKLLHCAIDSTFGMYRANFTRVGVSIKSIGHPSSGFRTYAPYAARHLDWYLDPKNMSTDSRNYMETASKVSHWGGTWLKEG